MIGQLLLGGGAKSLLHQQLIFRPLPWVLLQSILGNVGNHQLRESGFTKNALWLNIKGWILPEFFISQQNTTFAWIALRPCIAFFFFFLISTCMKFIILLTIKWMKHIPRTPEKPCESNMVTSGRRHVVQLSWMLSVPPWREILRCWTLWPLTPFHSALSACWSARHVEHCELKKKITSRSPLAVS